MSSYLRPRRGKATTATNTLTSSNPLKRGEVFFEVPTGGVGTGTGKIKMGDGSTAYGSLPYFLSMDDSAVTFTDNSSSSSWDSRNTYLGNIKSGISLPTFFQNSKNLLYQLCSKVTSLNNDLAGKANSSHSHNITDVTSLSNSLSEISNSLSNINTGRTFTNQTAFSGNIDTFDFGNITSKSVRYLLIKPCSGTFPFEGVMDKYIVYMDNDTYRYSTTDILYKQTLFMIPKDNTIPVTTNMQPCKEYSRFKLGGNSWSQWMHGDRKLGSLKHQETVSAIGTSGAVGERIYQKLLYFEEVGTQELSKYGNLFSYLKDDINVIAWCLTSVSNSALMHYNLFYQSSTYRKNAYVNIYRAKTGTINEFTFEVTCLFLY